MILTLGTFEYFSAHLRPLIQYPALKSDVLQAFREVGNVVLIVKMLEDVLAMEDTFLDVQTQGFIPRPGGNELCHGFYVSQARAPIVDLSRPSPCR